MGLLHLSQYNNIIFYVASAFNETLQKECLTTLLTYVIHYKKTVALPHA